jgi:dTDP-4-dehydrorhamnose 3,5-epimerase
MELITTDLSGLLILKPKVFEDERGYFFETFRQDTFQRIGVAIEVVQSNISKSDRGVVRGLHFQNPPHAQGKLVRVLRGSVLDVAVDIRKNSPTFGKSFSIELSESNKLGLWIPAGFAHGFRTLEDDTLFYYDCTALYNPAAEGGILWNDPELGIDWGIENPTLSAKDAAAPRLSDCISMF